MDDNGNEHEFDDTTKFMFTPKGFYMNQLMEHGASKEQAEECWLKFEAFCIKTNDIESHYTALIFDGGGGQVFGVEQTEVDDEL